MSALPYHEDESGTGFRSIKETLQPSYDDLEGLWPLEDISEAELDAAADWYAAQRSTEAPAADPNMGFERNAHQHACGHICRAAFCVYSGFAHVLCVKCQVETWENKVV